MAFSFFNLLKSAFLIPSLLESLKQQRYSPITSKTIVDEYDYVIVGAGSAGSVVASRLTEIPCVRVLLLEAGEKPPLLTEVPAFARFFWFTGIDWKYKTTPQKHTGDQLINRQVIWPSGKALGGTSVLNAMLYVRGNRYNYDGWAADGAEGWSYEEVLPYFIKQEDNRNPEFVADGFHGVGGPISAEQPVYDPEIKKPLFERIRSMGYEVVDPNAYSQTGFYDLQSSIRNGTRCSTAKGYLVPAENRTNLDILPNAMVRKVLIENNRAVGVQFDYKGKTWEVKARKEVIMSAGTTNTAQLLMLSGIGPREELEKFGIPVIADLPVGKNLQDHPGVPVLYAFKRDIPTVTEKIANPGNIEQYIQNRTGPLAATEFCAALAFLEDGTILPKTEYPDHQLYFVEAPLVLILQTGASPQMIFQLSPPYLGRGLYLCISSLVHPYSRGTVTLKSTDPYDPPLIDPNYFEDPRDVRDMVEGMKACKRINSSPEILKLATPFKTVMPGCENYVGDDDAYFACFIRAFAITFNHQVGTARMGRPDDPRTVVDPQLRVLKVEGLRVVDASVMPTTPSGNTNIPTIMVAEKASDIIKSTISCSEKDTYSWSKNYLF